MSSNNRENSLRTLGWMFHAGGALSLVVGILSYHFVASALIKKRHEESRQRISELDVKLARGDQIRNDHRAFTTSLTQIEDRADSMRQRIPDLPHETEFLRQVSEAAQLEGLTVLDYQRVSTTTKETHSQLEVRLNCEGDYASICGFLDRMTKLERVATVERMLVTSTPGSEVYPLDLTLVLYFGARRPDRGA